MARLAAEQRGKGWIVKQDKGEFALFAKAATARDTCVAHAAAGVWTLTHCPVFQSLCQQPLFRKAQ